ncbi:MAG: polysaccharide biosynthesis/export family protein [Planctomycetes bacterium]|nr:polysaccharide biosynthesis/export family protein [Planctomycetota bacterium]
MSFAHFPSSPARLLLAALLLLGLASCTASGKPIPELAREVNATRQSGPTRFLPGDRLSVRFANDPAMDQHLDVRPDGKASFLRIGDLQVAGKSPDELTAELTQAYKEKLSSPILSANLELSGEAAMRDNPRRFFVLGEVTFPGSFGFNGEGITIPKAISLAHGFNKNTAALNSMLLVRWISESEGYRGWKINADIEYWSAQTQVLLQPGDVLYVPNTTIDKVDNWVDKYIRQLIPFPYLSYYLVNQPATPTN